MTALELHYFEEKKFQGAKVAADWIRDLESSDSRLHKESVIEKALLATKIGSTNAQCFLFNCYQAYNPYYIFNVKKVPETKNLTDCENPWVDFWALLEGLRTRSITGHSARDAIAEISKRFDSVEWNNLARRVLIKDLRCGITIKTLNKVLEKTEWKIPSFTCQLAKDSADHPSKMHGTRRLEVKLDGVRALTVVQGNSVTIFSRNGKKFDNFTHIEEVFEQALLRDRPVSLHNFVIDGEITGKTFQELMRQARRKTDAQANDSIYYVFDIIPLEEFTAGIWKTPLKNRIDLLNKFVNNLVGHKGLLKVVPGLDVNLSTGEGRDQMDRFAKSAIEQGYEGILVKNLDAPYECKRSDAWLKWKPTITVDLTIVGYEEGTGRNQGRLGAIICEGVDNDRKISVNVGTGFSDTARDEYWESRNQLLDHMVEVQADAVTQNQDGTYSLRFPRFVRFRDFEAGEKL